MTERVGSGTRRVSLNGDQWSLLVAPRAAVPAPSLASAVQAGYRTLPAVVPDGIELDLERTGLIDDPFYGDNVEQVWSLEYGDWWYTTTFDLPEGWDPSWTSLLFHGLDTIADIYVNDLLVGSTRNMLIEHEIPVGNAVRAEINHLAVHLTSPLIYAEQFDYPAWLGQVLDEEASLWARKPAHMYGWDIAPRLISAGIHRAVELVERAPHRIVDWYFRTTEMSHDRTSARLELHYELSQAPRGREFTLSIAGRNPLTGKNFRGTAHPSFLAGNAVIDVDDPDLWFPRNYGDPSLYDVSLTLSIDGVMVDEHRTRVGIRIVEHDYRVCDRFVGNGGQAALV